MKQIRLFRGVKARTVVNVGKAVTVVLLALALIACGHQDNRTVTFSGSDPAVLLLPAHPDGRLVIYVHGAGGTERDIVRYPDIRRDVTALLGAGYMVASDRASGDNWGRAGAVRDQVSLYRRVNARSPVKEVYILAQSMGGLVGLRSVDVLPNVKAWAGIYPVCNLRSMRDSDYASELPPLSGPVVPRRVVPMMWWASPDDTVVPKRENTDRCSRLAQSNGADVTVVSTTGDHGDPSNFQPDRLVAFFESA